ncbi:MAG TPA: hypothetical protein VHG90_10905 [Acidimicrobiales bacterium]|nr:hypothetical protein [Acidimicrobiales bacterium]
MTTVHSGPTTPFDAITGAVPLDPIVVPPRAPARHDEESAEADAAVDASADPAVRASAASWFLRVGLAFVFTYAAVTSLVDPAAAATYFPAQLPADLVVDVLLPVFAGYEILLALVLLTGRHTYAAAVLAALTLAGIIVVNADAFGVLFRNVAIACAALALAADSRRSRRVPARAVEGRRRGSRR